MTVNDAMYGDMYYQEYIRVISYVLLVLCISATRYLRPEEDRSITVKTLAGFTSTFKLVPENCVSYLLQPAEKPPLQAAYNSV